MTNQPDQASRAPEWLSGWCAERLGSPVASVIFGAGQMSRVTGVRLTDGRAVVVKSRPDENQRAVACVAQQLAAAEQGFACARPLTGVDLVDGLAIHAEQWRPGGELRRSDGPDEASRSATVLAALTWLCAARMFADPAISGHIRAAQCGAGVLPNPPWLGWLEARDAGRDWPPHPGMDARAAETGRQLPDWLLQLLRLISERLVTAELPYVVGHGDWEAQNLRWDGDRIHCVHDWDSLSWLPEAAIVGAASGAFASAEVPTLAPVASSESFLAAYQQTSGRDFSPDEWAVAWAASMFPAVHNARAELLFDSPQVATAALRVQYPERLRRMSEATSSG